MDTDNRELYRIISGFPKYCISNRGRVMNILSGKYLSTSRNKHGYLLVDTMRLHIRYFMYTDLLHPTLSQILKTFVVLTI